MNTVLIGHIDRIDHHHSDLMFGIYRQAIPIFQRLLQGLRINSPVLTAFHLELAFQFGFCLVELLDTLLNVGEQYLVGIREYLLRALRPQGILFCRT